MGMLFESLGVLPSADVVQVSATEFSTGFVGQTWHGRTHTHAAQWSLMVPVYSW